MKNPKKKNPPQKTRTHNELRQGCNRGLGFHSKSLGTEIELIRTARMADVESGDKSHTPHAKFSWGLQGVGAQTKIRKEPPNYSWSLLY